MLRRNLCKNDDPPISQYPVGKCMFKVNNRNNALTFLNIIESLYDECFPVAKTSSKQKKYFTHCITRGIKKSTKKGRNYKKISKR